MTNYEMEQAEYEALTNTPEARAVLGLPEWPPLPAAPVAPCFDPEWLPPVPRAMAQSVTDNLSVPFDLPALLALGVASSCACGRVRVRVREGWEEPVQLFLLGILDSGEGKSPAFGKMCSLLFERQAEENQRRAVQIARDAAAIDTLEAEKAKAIKKGSRADAEAIAEQIAQYPVTHSLRRFIQGNVTPEAIPDIMQENGGATAQMDDEGELFEVLAGRYQDVPSLDPWLKGYTGTTPLESMRRGRCVTVNKPAMAAMILSQPGTLTELLDNRRMSAKGFIGRFLISVPPPVKEYGEEPPIPDSVAAAYHAAVLRLYDLRPQTCTLTPEARSLFFAFRDEMRKKKCAEWEPLKRFEFIGKLPGTLARLAGVLHLWKSEAGEIDAATMREAEAILRYFIGHTLHLIGTESGLTTPAKEALALLMKQGQPVQKERELKRKLAERKLFRADGTADAALDELEKAGYIRREQEKGAGRPVLLVRLHPDLLPQKEVVDL